MENFQGDWCLVIFKDFTFSAILLAQFQFLICSMCLIRDLPYKAKKHCISFKEPFTCSDIDYHYFYLSM